MQCRRQTRKVSGCRRRHERGAHLVLDQEAGCVEDGCDPRGNVVQEAVKVFDVAVLDAGEQRAGRLRLLDAEVAFHSEARDLRGRLGGTEGHGIRIQRDSKSRLGSGEESRDHTESI